MVGRYLQIHDLFIAKSPLSDANIRRVDDRIEQCITLHSDKCGIEDSKINSTRDMAPTRLLYIANNELRLVVLKEVGRIDEYFHYCTLSYCWGDPPPLKTERATLGDRLRHIPYDSLPSVFKDAVRVARATGIGYLWIDSLCILQDDPEDWRRESRRMADIYRNGVFTIAAVASPSSHDSFLVPRLNPPLVEMPFTSTQYPDQISGSHYIRRDTGIINALDELEQSRWGSRGWRFQEQFLSKRLIAFGPSMLQFHCRKSSLRENCQANFLRDIPDAPLHSRDDHGDCECHEHSNRYRVWYKLVEPYSGCDLTFIIDRLPSIQGIAQDMAANLSRQGELFHRKVSIFYTTSHVLRPFSGQVNSDAILLDGSFHR